MRLPYFTLTFDSSPIKGEGDSVGCVVLLLPRPVDVDSRLRGNDGVVPCAVDTALKPV